MKAVTSSIVDVNGSPRRTKDVAFLYFVARLLLLPGEPGLQPPFPYIGQSALW